MLTALARKILGNNNDRILKGFKKTVEKINAFETTIQALNDTELRAQTDKFKKLLTDNPSSIEDILPEAFATAREAANRALEQRPFDVQLMGGIALHQGYIPEMRTGEGKTLTATLPIYLNALTGEGVHVVTVNDYLASRDADWMKPIYSMLGLSVGSIVANMEDDARREAYAADITYGTNNEFGFDYLRDNMVVRQEDRVQRAHNYAIIDEVDSVLIDEARTPLIISGAAGESEDLYHTFARLAPRLEGRPDNAEEGGDYFIDLKEHAVSATEEGVAKMEKLLNIRDLYGVETDPRLPRHFEQALRAHALYKRDRDYIVKDGE
ncbi:MAG: preprotein translocase subunit SecA, partial [Hyphomicrobiaceae bacterium]|nr:preprotein translocase subunit SecA [Hyphomicrobiaceae bacterium]